VRVAAAIAVSGLLLAAAQSARAAEPTVAALQVVLRARGVYAGPIDGVRSTGTDEALRRAQRRARLVPDGVVGPLTRRALRLRPLGSRALRAGSSGPDVVELQFALAQHGFPSGTFDGTFGPRTERAVGRFQRWARLAADGVAGPATFTALRVPPPSLSDSFAPPVAAAITDGFGPRGDRFHTGVDLPVPAGTGVVAGAPGRVAYAGWLDGGWGLLVAIAHGDGVRTLYAHLSRVEVRVGERVQTGWEVGRVGATGDATGPHLHFEVRIRGAAIDPAPALTAL
jgi:murein DD-endopeptidase MepM/ murein hydrolase activator NlpD